MRSCRRVRSCRRAKRGKRISVASYNLRLDQKRASSSESSSSSNIPRKGVEEAVLPSMKVDAHGRNRNGSSRERVFLPESSSDLDILRKGVEKAPLPSAIMMGVGTMGAQWRAHTIRKKRQQDRDRHLCSSWCWPIGYGSIIKSLFLGTSHPGSLEIQVRNIESYRRWDCNLRA